VRSTTHRLGMTSKPTAVSERLTIWLSQLPHLAVSFRQVVHSILSELVGVTRQQPCSEGSDGLEFICWNGEVVRQAFIIDACDREVIAWSVVSGAGTSGSDVRDMMLMAVERRFGTRRAPEPIEMLSDNGSPYTARETRTFARQLGLKPCFTPVRSPQSNGMAEAFVHRFKRDYVRLGPLPDAKAVLKLIGS